MPASIRFLSYSCTTPSTNEIKSKQPSIFKNVSLSISSRVNSLTMASFLSLPNELLIEIWRYVLHPEDIESFALTSRGILALAEPFLEDHRTLKKKFSTCYTWRPAGKVSAAGLLKEITMNSRVALYVKRLVINVWRDSWEPLARQVKSSIPTSYYQRNSTMEESISTNLTPKQTCKSSSKW